MHEVFVKAALKLGAGIDRTGGIFYHCKVGYIKAAAKKNKRGIADQCVAEVPLFKFIVTGQVHLFF